jgi:hypothetical protein
VGAVVGIVVGLLVGASGFSALLDDRSAWPTATATYAGERFENGRWLLTYEYVGPDDGPLTFTDISVRSLDDAGSRPATIQIRWPPGQPGVREKVVPAPESAASGVIGLALALVALVVLVFEHRTLGGAARRQSGPD